VLAVLLVGACFPPPLDETGKRCSESRPCGEGFLCVRAGCLREDLFDGGLDEDDGGLDAGDATDDGGSDGGLARDGGADGGGMNGGTDGGTDGGADGGVDAGPELAPETNLLRNASFDLELSDGGVRSWRSTNGTMVGSSPGRTGSRAARLSGQSFMGPSITSDLISGGTGFGMLFCARAYGRNEFDAGYTFTISIRERLFDGGTNPSSGQTSRTLQRDAGWVAVTEEYGAIGGRGVELRISSDVRSDASVLVDDAELYWTPTGRCVFP
jgi:hypothetical protein